MLLSGAKEATERMFFNGRLYVKNREMPLGGNSFNHSVLKGHETKIYNEKICTKIYTSCIYFISIYFSAYFFINKSLTVELQNQ